MALNKIVDELEKNLKSVDELINFDKIILDFSINQIDKLNEKLKNGPCKIDNPYLLAENTSKAIKNVRENNSLRIQYQSVFNSCLVLQVSYFTNALEEIFKYCLETNYRDKFENIPPAKRDFNFQNIHSSKKAFEKSFSYKFQNSSKLNTIILALCSRHAIVHSLGKADQKFLNHTNPARPRDIKHEFELHQEIQYTPSELEFIRLSMIDFINDLSEDLTKKLGLY